MKSRVGHPSSRFWWPGRRGPAERAGQSRLRALPETGAECRPGPAFKLKLGSGDHHAHGPLLSMICSVTRVGTAAAAAFLGSGRRSSLNRTDSDSALPVTSTALARTRAGPGDPDRRTAGRLGIMLASVSAARLSLQIDLQLESPPPTRRRDHSGSHDAATGDSNPARRHPSRQP